ncbi:Polysaccharide deacetylase [Pseudobythopirellula maris]|uniref:Polysaccharide deacetylase n=1 Tax=Pseudobythopirellula maris TaxID=2527991 RepID=A0A5C5ZRY7_9BACT|nr:polysaccharide deacetylase family protein [Pseudobythopirellula maris]TWT89697.1 Polysaccharide deacetylase [Pseudobythopirellula maris]
MSPWRQLALRAYGAATWPQRRALARTFGAERRWPVSVLFYHRVADDRPNDWTIGRRAFRRQINWLSKRFDLVSLAEAQRRLAAGDCPRPTACITFDDGYADNCDYAIPLLLRNRVPFTYFVSTENMIHGLPFSHDEARGEPLRPNTIEELRAMASAGVEIGAHTRSHAHLGRSRDHDWLVEEIAGSKCDLETRLESEVRYFAFPYGTPDTLTSAALSVAREAGFHGACAAYGGYNLPGECDDAFLIQRIHADPEWARFWNWMTIDPRKLSIAAPETPPAANDSPSELSVPPIHGPDVASMVEGGRSD